MFLRARVMIGWVSLAALGVVGLLTAPGCGSSNHAGGAGGASGSPGAAGGTPSGGSSGKAGSAGAGGGGAGGASGAPGGAGGTSSGGSSGKAGSVGAGGGGGAPDAGGRGGGNATGFVSGSSCTNAQTQFAFTALGDSNPLFTSGVGVRAPSRMLAFTGSSAPTGAGGAGGAGGAVNTIYWQAFDVTSAKSLGPAQPLASFTDSGGRGPIRMEDASISPSGEIAILYSHIETVSGHPLAVGVSALFLSAETSNEGDGAPQIAGVVQLETDPLTSEGLPFDNAAHAIWSPQAKAFVFSWGQHAQASPVAYAKVVKFLPSGAAAGGNTDPVPTGPVNPGYTWYGSGSVATTGAFFGVAYLPYGYVSGYLTVLDGTGNAVTEGVAVETSTTIQQSDSTYWWVTAAGTSKGIVYLLGSLPVSEYFIPVDGSGQVVGAADTFTGFKTSGSAGATIVRAISDYSSGSDGVAATLLYPDAVSFLYVQSDGVAHVGPSQAISHARVTGDGLSITEFAGSFGLALYSAADHRMQMSASGCTK